MPPHASLANQVDGTLKRVIEEVVNTTDYMFDADKIFYRLQNTDAPQRNNKETLNFVTFFPMKDRPEIWKIPENSQRTKMGSFHIGKGDLPAGVWLDKQSHARDRLMWVQLTRENLLTRDDLMENTHSTLQRICRLGDLTRI